MFRLEIYAILARDRQREVIEEVRVNALLRERRAALKAMPDRGVVPQSPAADRRQPASGSAMVEARAAEGNR